MKSFRCNFGDGVAVTCNVSDEAPTANIAEFRIEWEGKPKKKMLRPYIGWMNSVQTQLANEWNKKLMYVYMLPSGKNEIWKFEPGKPCEFVAVL